MVVSMYQSNHNSDNPRRPSRSRHFIAKKPSLVFSLVLGIALISFWLSLTITFFHIDHSTEKPTKNLPVEKPEPVAASLRRNEAQYQESIEELRSRLPPSIWTLAGRNSDPQIAEVVSEQLLNSTEKDRALSLCGKLLYSTISRAVEVHESRVWVKTGDIENSMWNRDSTVQMGIYMGRMGRHEPYLRSIVEGTIRRQAFNIIQDPYANAYSRKWRDPKSLPLKDRVIGRGGWVDTRNYELDSGAYFLNELYDYYVAENLYRPELLLQEPIIFDAVMLTVDTWIVEQNHDKESPYKYFELPNGGRGAPTRYTGMTWTGFRPSDDASRYGYLIPANIHAAAGLERILELNTRIWQSQALELPASTLLKDIEEGIRRFGVVEVNNTKSGTTERVYAYEVDGAGNALKDFDDANVPSLLSIPVLGWSGYDRQVYRNTRARILDPDFNKFYYDGPVLSGIGSPHTPKSYVWPMALAVEALTEEKHIAEAFAFQIRQSLASACNDAMHESVSSRKGCPAFSRQWFEWANALFVVLIETAFGQRCDAFGKIAAQEDAAANAGAHSTESKPPLRRGGTPEELAQLLAQYTNGRFYDNKYHNDPATPEFYQGVESLVKYTD